MSELLLMIDGHSLAFRAFYALPPEMVARDGTPTNAVYGFCSMMTNLLAQYKPSHFAVAFDTAAPTFRTEMDEEYKAQREETPELFVPQVDLIIEMLEAMNIPVCMQDGVEADDIIATYSTKAEKKELSSLCVTGDRDYFQLVKDPHVKVMYVRRGVSDTVVYDEAGIIERTGIRPDQYVDYAAMRGDPSDNLPGVNGVGEKTAAKYLNQYENLEGIYQNMMDLTPKQREKLVEGEERAFLNREIMTLVRNVKGLPSISALKRKQGNAEEILALCDRLQFRSMAKRLLEGAMTSSQDAETSDSVGKSSEQIADPSNKKIIELDVDKFEKLLGALKSEIAIHLPPLPPRAHVDGISFPIELLACSAKAINKVSIKNKSELKKIASALKSSFGNIVGYDIKRWGSYFSFVELDLPAFIDLNIMAALDDPSRNKKTLDQTVASYLGIAPTETDEQLGLDLDGDSKSSDVLVISSVGYLLDLYQELLQRLESKKLTKLYADIEQPLTPVISFIETSGVFVDQKRLEIISKDIHERCRKYEEEIHSYAGEPFNVNSTKQLQYVLFDKLGLTPIKKTKTGASTDAATLHALQDEHEIVEAILRYREVEKLRSTYVDVLGPLIAGDGRIHATFNQAITSTGRISGEAPNMQNIPIRTEEGKNLRTMFVAPEGKVLCSIDYSQIELRVLAHLSKEKALVDAFSREDDVHTITAAEVFNVNQEDVTSDQRRFAKVVNYGIAYGMESFGLATRMGIAPAEAKEILDSYWTTFKSMKKYLDSVIVQAKKKGYTETIFGRRRYFPELSSSIARMRMAGERAATNAPVQGTAADIFKLAMIQVHDLIRTNNLDAKMVLTVHDELVFEVDESNAQDIAQQIAKTMENVVELDVPLVADVGIGPNWAEAK